MSNFRQDSINFLNGNHVNMGPHQYEDHAGMRDGVSMSGFRLWLEADQKRAAASEAAGENMASVERATARMVARDIEAEELLPEALHAIELGPGTVSAFDDQTLPIIRAFHKVSSIVCKIVDKSQKFINDIRAEQKFSDIQIDWVNGDFFGDRVRYFDEDKDALLIMFGTISNLHAPVSNEPPIQELADTLTNLADKIRRGWLLFSFDADQDGEKIKTYYREHPDFQINIFYRMQVEGLAEGWLDNRFDPKAFDYEPEWHAGSGQLAHMAVLNRDMTFTMDGQEITLKKGQKLHMKNSFKLTPELFEAACEIAHLDVTRAWLDTSVKFYLMKKLMPATDPLPQPKLGSNRQLIAA